MSDVNIIAPPATGTASGADEPVVEVLEEIIEPVLSAEEIKEVDISKELDAGQVRVHALNKCGTPLKYMIVRSAKQAEEVVHIPEYFALKDGDDVIGYQRWGEQTIIQARGTKVSVAEPVVIGDRQRGE